MRSYHDKEIYNLYERRTVARYTNVPTFIVDHILYKRTETNINLVFFIPT